MNAIFKADKILSLSLFLGRELPLVNKKNVSKWKSDIVVEEEVRREIVREIQIDKEKVKGDKVNEKSREKGKIQ